jgi:hypothetical protein
LLALLSVLLDWTFPRLAAGIVYSDKGMKTTCLVLSVALALCTGTLNARANGGSCGGCFFWPFMAFGLGLALASSSSQASTVTYYPVYVPPPVPVYPSQAPPQAEIMHPSAPVATSWIPSSPGAGKWVPDAQPYHYTPGILAIAHPINTSATSVAVVTNAPGGVPVFIVSHVVTPTP